MSRPSIRALIALALATNVPLPSIDNRVHLASEADRARWSRQSRADYKREGGAIRHRRAWSECPICKTKCAKPGVAAQGEVRR